MKLTHLIAVALLVVPAVLQAQADTTALRKELVKTAADYENSLRSSAPHRLSQAGFCSERVGRFCVIYDAGRKGLVGADPKDVRDARAKVIRAHQQAVAIWPNDSTMVAPLLRYLIEDGRGAEAVTLAREYLKLTEDAAAAWAHLLLGYALHGAGDDGAAEEAFARGLRLALPIERVAMHDVTLLLAREERDKYNALAGQQRSSYQSRLWQLADPLYLTPGNESLIEHLARRVHSRIQAGIAATEWAPDEESLVMRYGPPTTRTQQFTPAGKVITQHSDPEQLTYVPPALLSKGGVNRYEPGAAWPYDTIRSQSGYAPRSIRWLQVLQHQVSRFPMRDSATVRGDFTMQLDSAVTLPALVEIALFALDSMYQVVAAQVDTVNANGSTFSARIETRAPVTARAYSLEARELATRQAGRARYAFTPLSRGRLTLSDLVIVTPSGDAPASSRASADFKPVASLEIPRGAPIGLFLETRGLSRTADRTVRYRVDLEVLEQDRPGAVGRAVRGLARALGVARQDVAPRISWSETKPAAEIVPISLQLGQVNLDPGLKLFRVTVTDMSSGAASIAVVDRLIRIRQN